MTGGGRGGVVIVDWLGRGGIAQTTAAWAAEIEAHDSPVVVVTRPGRELTGSQDDGPVDDQGGRIAAHRNLVRRAVRVIDAQRPEVVVVQNYVLPPLEWPVFQAARRVGARVVLVVHDHRLHTLKAGTRLGLRRAVRFADVVVVHSAFVADAVGSLAGGRDVRIVPLPVQVGMVDGRPSHGRDDLADPATAVHFGVLRRSYKGTSTVLDLARSGVPGWRFRLIGTGAPVSADGVDIVPGYVSSSELVAAVEQSHVTVLPYRFATQSGAVVLAQALGSVVVTTNVGGLPDQVEDGVTGRLLAVDAPVPAWRDALIELSDPVLRGTMSAAARSRAWADHDRFAAAVRELAVGGHAPA